ncbi:uncharacterized protein LOC111086708 [Limulus polyphemus]|uniref:Uncharacterized protein LOC111086708 n=1 Tax=Limulus polyphemus TaxID=6850 RepID=A0ABM1SRU9_LIMPO|nr:uncharacterized protein LOC111086708 [Limulus polyphemus]
MVGSGNRLSFVLVWSMLVVIWGQRPLCSLRDVATIEDLEELIQLTARSLGVREMSLLKQLQGHLDEKRYVTETVRERKENIPTSQNVFISPRGPLIPMPPPGLRPRSFRQLPRRPDNGFFSTFKMTTPPAGVRVKIISDHNSVPLFDVIVTLSPLMSVEDALHQASIKYSRMMSLPLARSLIVLHHSQLLQCSIVKGMPEISEFRMIRILDKDENVVYDNMCIPSPQELLVEPGMTIIIH